MLLTVGTKTYIASGIESVNPMSLWSVLIPLRLPFLRISSFILKPLLKQFKMDVWLNNHFLSKGLGIIQLKQPPSANFFLEQIPPPIIWGPEVQDSCLLAIGIVTSAPTRGIPTGTSSDTGPLASRWLGVMLMDAKMQKLLSIWVIMFQHIWSLQRFGDHNMLMFQNHLRHYESSWIFQNNGFMQSNIWYAMNKMYHGIISFLNKVTSSSSSSSHSCIHSINHSSKYFISFHSIPFHSNFDLRVYQNRHLGVLQLHPWPWNTSGLNTAL